MRKYKYNFDWQENVGYEEIEALNKQTMEKGEADFGECLSKKTKYKNFNHNSTNKSPSGKVFGLMAARSAIK